MNPHQQHFVRVSHGAIVRTIAVAAFIVAGLLGAGWTAAQSALPPFDKVGISPPVGKKLPLELNFVNADGDSIRLAEAFANRPVVLHLVYYECPVLCRLSSDGLFRGLSTLSLKVGTDFSVVTLSFDPREGPEHSRRARRLAMERYEPAAVEGGWHFLTGTSESISELCSALGFRYAYDEASRQFAHASGVFVLTPEGKLSRFLSGVEFSPRDLRLALVEASSGNVGSAADQVMLLCYMYDPLTGKYGLAIMSAIRATGVLTVVGLAAAIFVMLRRDRNRSALRRNDGGSRAGKAQLAIGESPGAIYAEAPEAKYIGWNG
jgi:protein SCO1/2